MKKTLDYEKSIERLEEIVEQLESGKLSLEESIKIFEEGTKLSASCCQILQKAEQKITQLSSLEKTMKKSEVEQ